MEIAENKNELGFCFRAKMTTLSPVHIGNGENIAPWSQHINITNQSGDFVLVNKTNVLTEPKNEIDAFINSDGKNYLPGSSLKGAIRTTILYKWLKSDYGKKALKLWLEELDKQYTSNNLKGISRAFNSGTNRDKKGIEQECFGHFKNMGSLKIIDSEFISESNLTIYQIERYYLKTRNHTDKTTFKECIKPNVSFETQIRFSYLKRQEYTQKEKYSQLLKSDFSSKLALCQLLNDHTKAVLEYEREVMSYSDYVINERVEEYTGFMNGLLTHINNADSNTAYIRLGYGKMQFYQTVAPSVFDLCNRDEENDTWINFLHYCFNFKDDAPTMPYPKTRALTAVGQLPLGWIKLELI